MSALIEGDPQLASRLGALVRHGGPAAIAFVTTEGTRVAVRAAAPTSTFEIGSVSKGVTGLLYADAIGRGEITPETLLGEVLQLGDATAGEITLGALSIHQSGLPRLAPSMHPLRKTFDLWRHGTNPYGEDLDELLDQARTVKVGAPRPLYSNLGFELLGHAVAAAAGSTYAQLLRERITEPLGMPDTYVPATLEQVRPNAVQGTNRRGRPQQPWTGEAIGPAGGIRSSIADMATLTAALLNGSAPGSVALTPTSRFGPRVRIGAAWITLESKGRQLTWHNGGTGGFRSWMGVDRANGLGAVVLSATSASVDRAGFALIASSPER